MRTVQIHTLEDSSRTQEHTPAVCSKSYEVVVPQTQDLT